jgi:hypothetical protein
MCADCRNSDCDTGTSILGDTKRGGNANHCEDTAAKTVTHGKMMSTLLYSLVYLDIIMLT